MSGGGDDGFLGRWSRRKRAAAAGGDAQRPDVSEGPEVSDAPGEPPDAAPPEQPPDAEEVDAEFIASLPRIEEIVAGTDVRPFLRRGVPEALKNAALRAAWKAHPVISTYEDPARDYFWDYNAPGGAPGGGGSLSPGKVGEMARRLLGGAAQDDTAGDAPLPGAPAPDVPPAPDPAPPPETASEATAAPAAPPPEGAPAAAVPEPAERPVAAAPRRRHGGAMPG